MFLLHTVVLFENPSCLFLIQVLHLVDGYIEFIKLCFLSNSVLLQFKTRLRLPGPCSHFLSQWSRQIRPTQFGFSVFSDEYLYCKDVARRKSISCSWLVLCFLRSGVVNRTIHRAVFLWFPAWTLVVTCLDAPPFPAMCSPKCPSALFLLLIRLISHDATSGWFLCNTLSDWRKSPNASNDLVNHSETYLLWFFWPS